MADNTMPNVTGKGPALIREALEVFGAIDGQCSGLSTGAGEQIKLTLAAKREAIEPLLSRAYMKTVKAGETAWACKELAEELKRCVEGSQEAQALEALGRLGTELDGLTHKVKTFVVRMT